MPQGEMLACDRAQASRTALMHASKCMHRSSKGRDEEPQKEQQGRSPALDDRGQRLLALKPVYDSYSTECCYSLPYESRDPGQCIRVARKRCH